MTFGKDHNRVTHTVSVTAQIVLMPRASRNRGRVVASFRVSRDAPQLNNRTWRCIFKTAGRLRIAQKGGLTLRTLTTRPRTPHTICMGVAVKMTICLRRRQTAEVVFSHGCPLPPRNRFGVGCVLRA